MAAGLPDGELVIAGLTSVTSRNVFEDWRTIAALWGAGLSSFLAVLTWLRDRPVTFVKPMPGDEKRGVLIVQNPSKRPMHITRVRYRNVQSKWLMPGTYPQGYGAELSAALLMDTFSIYIPPEGKAEMTISSAVPRAVWIWLSWHRHGWLPRFPLLVRLTKKRLMQIEDAASVLSKPGVAS